MKAVAALAALAMTGLNLTALALAGCAGSYDPKPEVAPFPGPRAEREGSEQRTGPIDDGTYLARIDPLGGRWQVERIGTERFAPGIASVDFSDGFFLSTTAGCGGGLPAFYRLDGAAIAVTRREPVRIGKCPNRAGAGRERRLAGFIDKAARWAKPAPDRLEISAAGGAVASLSRPVEPNPRLAGRWRVVSIDGRGFATRRPAEVVFEMRAISATADCNRWGAPLGVAGDRLTIGRGIQTLIGCGAADQAKDTALFNAVAGATRFALEGEDRLLLRGKAALLLERPPEPDHRLVGRYAHCGNTVGGVGHAGPVTLAITPERMTDNAGCTARYTAAGPELSLALGSAPACRIAPAAPDGYPEVGGAISPLALLRPDGFGFSADGRLFLRTNRGLLALCREGEPRRFGD